MSFHEADGMPDRGFGQKCHKTRESRQEEQDLQDGQEEVGQSRSAAEKDCQRQLPGEQSESIYRTFGFLGWSGGLREF